MRELHAAIPDPAVVLALEPEELGAKLLFLLRTKGEPFVIAGVLDELSR